MYTVAPMIGVRIAVRYSTTTTGRLHSSPLKLEECRAFSVGYRIHRRAVLFAVMLLCVLWTHLGNERAFFVQHVPHTPRGITPLPYHQGLLHRAPLAGGQRRAPSRHPPGRRGHTCPQKSGRNMKKKAEVVTEINAENGRLLVDAAKNRKKYRKQERRNHRLAWGRSPIN